MKKIIVILLFISQFSIFNSAFSQIVVPEGWETKDSVRFGLNTTYLSSMFYFGLVTGILNQNNAISDSVGANFDEEFSNLLYQNPLHGRIAGYATYGQLIWDSTYVPGTSPYKTIPITSFTGLGLLLQQRIYYADSTPFPLQWDNSYGWRYNDLRFNSNATVHRNMYDSNDISSYVEFPRNDGFVSQTYVTHRFDTTGDTSGHTVIFGNEGRVILGYSDNRNAQNLLVTSNDYNFFPGHPTDTARTFSATLEFNIDTASINLSGDTVGHDSLPLVRFQILYKKGGTSSGTGVGWTVLPFVPFKTANDTVTNPGWFKVIDTTITYNIYKTLPDDWRVEDVTAGGSLAHSGWHFKQLHVILKDMPRSMRDQITLAPDDSLRLNMGQASDSSTKGILTFQNPDSLVAQDTDIHTIQKYLLESRILSTYRATVRVRSMTWQDTVVDKFLYRWKAGSDSSYSVYPNGTANHYDDTVSKYAKRFHDSCAVYNSTQQHEILFNDVGYSPLLSSLAYSGIAYVDYILSRNGIHCHAREQDWGGSQTEQYRRERLSFDGKPPSMYENQQNVFAADDYSSNDVFPCDYVFNSDSINVSARLAINWPHSGLDSMAGMIIARIDKSGSGDSLAAYKKYTYLYGGLNNGNPDAYKSFVTFLRNSTRFASEHPLNRRFAIESAIQGWGLTNGGDSASIQYYFQRPTTPEETQGSIFAALANGVTAFNCAQAFGGGAGIAGYELRNNLGDGSGDIDSTIVVDNYNFGHPNGPIWTEPTRYSATNELYRGTPKYYIGYSNTFRAFKRAIARINQIYDTTHGRSNIPLKRLTWLNAYSANRALGSGSNLFGIDDSLTRTQAFLKCDSTVPVRKWVRGTHNEYIDSLNSSGRGDSGKYTYVEVGLFKDSISSTTVNYAALLVNTRLWPSLRDGEDSIYYNSGLGNAADRSQSSLGDIDVRKVFFHIDTTKFDPSFRTQYYTIRDLWHPDSVYLLKCDSNFAIYIKPGDAKFLYIEKAISIQVAKTAAVSASGDFLFNNGRRVAERMKGTRTVETYTRGGQLYVSDASIGTIRPGYNQHSAGDNIATGSEIMLDGGGCERPSIMVGRDDQSVAIAYWKSSTQHLHVAYQAHPDSVWLLAEDTTYTLTDTSTDYSMVTPVLTPINDTDWVVEAGYRRIPTDLVHTTAGIVGARFRYTKNASPYPAVNFLADGFQYLYPDLATDISVLNQSYFPTTISRPLADSLWPIRFAWQKGGIPALPALPQSIILGRRFTWNTTSPSAPVLDVVYNISKGLPSFCYNVHPNYGMCGINDLWQSIVFGTPYMLNDYVTWEAKVFDTTINTQNKYWPILHQFAQPLYQRNGFWKRQFQVFTPDVTVDSYRYPLVSAANYKAVSQFFSPNPKKGTTYYHDILRMLWGNSSDTIQFAHWLNGWYYGKLSENGLFPSLPQTTDSVEHWISNAVVPLSTVFVGNETYLGNNEVRITNGWSPIIDPRPQMMALRVFLVDSTGTSPCGVLYGARISIDPHLTVVHSGGGGSLPVQWSQGDPTDGTILNQSWPVTPPNPVEVHSDSVTLNAGDSIYIKRTFNLYDTTRIRNSLASTSDSLILDFVLRKASDSSVIMRVERSYITKSASMLLPGTGGLDTMYAKFKYPTGSSTVTAFITAELKRTQLDSLSSVIIEYEAVDSMLPSEAFKKAAKPQSQPAVSALSVTVVPNPFNQSTTVKISSAEGLPTHVEVFDLVGKKVADLFNENFPSSPIEIRFEAAMLSSGSYLVRIQSGSQVETRRIQLLK